MLSIATGYDPRYLTGEVAKGTENYYTREVGRGEPPGVWQGHGAAELGLSGPVRDAEMEALFVHFVDPRDAAFRSGTRRDWARAARLGRAPRKYRTAAELLAEALAREPLAEPERVLQLRRLAEGAARKPVAPWHAKRGPSTTFGRSVSQSLSKPPQKYWASAKASPTNSQETANSLCGASNSDDESSSPYPSC